jgi:microcystin-dependent protein
MSQPFIAEIRVFAGTFAPQGYALCNGQLLPVSQNAALFAVIGTTYGGDGVTSFALPNLQGRANNHMGAGPGLSPYVQGETAGEETHTLIVEEMPAHNHALVAAATETTATPSTSVVLGSPTALIPTYGAAASLTSLSPTSVSPTFDGGAHENRQPYLVLNYIIALFGVFPTRN